jgi:tripeptide aminopeptidase
LFLRVRPMIMSTAMTDTVVDRFLRYVVIDTQSNSESETTPSTAKQKDLGQLLVGELLAMGVSDAHMDEHGYVYATIPANTDKDVPVICFCSHMDTAPDFTGTNVKPQIVREYQGGDIQLIGDASRVIRVKEHPELLNQIGHDIITSDGTTLLGADDKAGLAEIMSAAQLLVSDASIKHGTIRLMFTPDEEIGRGVDKADLEKLGAQFAYTVDGETAGDIEDETFSADGVEIAIEGVAIHPGFAKGRMVNAIKVASAIVARLPQDQAPETTDGRQGFIHPIGVTGSMASARIGLIVRDFEEAGLTQKEALLEEIARDVVGAWPGASYTLKVTQQYRNMKVVLKDHPEIVENAVAAIERVGLTPHRGIIRGGTDGSRLSHMGLPCPNLFAGGHAFHSPLEWISRQDMEKAVAVIVEVAKVWEERA